MTSEQEHSDADASFVAQLTDIQVPLLLYVRSLLPGDSAAMDVAQQANGVVWKKRDEFVPGTNFKAWVFSVARFEVLNYRKQQARDEMFVFSEGLENMMTEELQQETLEVDRRGEALAHCLELLRPRDRDLMMHRYAGKGTLREFAEKTGRSVSGLKVSLHRLRNTLLDCIERQLAAEGRVG